MVQAEFKVTNWIRTAIGAALVVGSLQAPAAEGDNGEESMRLEATPEQRANEALFQEGMQALEDERMRSAVRAFSEILDTDPELHRAQLELAYTYYRTMRYREAEELAKRVLDDPLTPPEVRVTILAFLAQVKRDAEVFGQKHKISGFLATGIMHDTNVNVGPSTDNLRGQETGLFLDPDSLSQSDNAYVGNIGFDHLYQSGRHVDVGETTGMLLWQSGGSVYWRRYHEENDNDLLVASVNTGPAVMLLRKWRASLQFQSDYLMLAGHALAWFNGFTPTMTWQLNNGELAVDANYTNRNYNRKEDDGLEGDYGHVGLTYGRYVDNRNVSLTAGVRGVAFNADDDQYGYTGGQFNAGISAKSWPDAIVYARGRYSNFYYDDDTPNFDKKRHDQEYRATLGFTYEFKKDDDLLKDWAVNGFWERTHNDSNISGLYTYKRYQMMLMLSRTF